MHLTLRHKKTHTQCRYTGEEYDRKWLAWLLCQLGIAIITITNTIGVLSQSLVSCRARIKGGLLRRMRVQVLRTIPDPQMALTKSHHHRAFLTAAAAAAALQTRMLTPRQPVVLRTSSSGCVIDRALSGTLPTPLSDLWVRPYSVTPPHSRPCQNCITTTTQTYP